MSKYYELTDHEGFKIDPSTEVIRFACCDCGMVHTMAMAKEGKTKIIVAFKSERRATAQLRRHEYGHLHEGAGLWRLVKHSGPTGKVEP